MVNDFLVNKELIKDMNFQKNGLWDMTFKNCFYIDNELYFFDQEWAEENLPTEYILYRSILYTISLRRFINIEDWFNKYDLVKYRAIFEELDNKMQEKIRDNKIWEFYSRNQYFDIDSTKQEMINMKIRDNAKQALINNLQKEKQQIQFLKDLIVLIYQVQSINMKMKHQRLKHVGSYQKKNLKK